MYIYIMEVGDKINPQRSLKKGFALKAGLYHRPNQINEMNDSRAERCFQSPLK